MKKVKLKDIAEINPRKSEIDKDAVDNVSFVAMADVSEDGFISEHETRPLSEVYSGYTYFKKGDVLLAKITPCFENGKAAIADSIPNEIGFGSSEFHVFRTNGEILPKYLFYSLWNEPFREQVSKKMTGSAGQKRVPTNFLKDYKIPLPTLSEQKAIVSKLDRAQRLIEIDKEMLAKYDELIQSVFLEMFGDPLKNPKEWRKAKMENIALIQRGGSPRPINDFLGGKVPWIKISDGTSGDDIYIDSTKEHIIEEGVSKSRLLEPGSLILANCGVSLGFARIIRIRGCIHDGWLSIANIKEDIINPIFLLKQLNHLTDHFRRTAPDGTQPNLNTTIVKKLEIMIPPKLQQDEFVKLVLNVREETDKIDESLKNSEELFSSLVQGAFG